MPSDAPPVLELDGITKQFPGTLANDHIEFDLRPREVHALLGENGAGKSTLMNILYGLYRPDEGEIRINGAPVRFHSSKDAIEAGIGMVHQHFMLIPVMTVAENVVLANEPTEAGGLFDRRRRPTRVRTLAASFGFAIDPRTRPGAERRPATARRNPEGALPRGRDPDPRRADRGADAAGGEGAVRHPAASWRPSGMSIIFISHKLHEVLAIADRITVLRRGRKIGDDHARGSHRGRTRAHDGRPRRAPPRREAARAPRGAAARGGRISRAGRPGTQAVRGRVVRRVAAGEIVGIAGVEGQRPGGADRSADRPAARRRRAITVGGSDARQATCPRLSTPGSAHIPADRQRRGLVAATSRSAENLALDDYPQSAKLDVRLAVPRAARRARAASSSRNSTCAAAVRRRSPSALSGGNQQKVVLAREIDAEPERPDRRAADARLDIGAIESSTAGSSRSATRAARSCSSRRARRDPLALRSHPGHLRGRIVGEFPPTSTEEELGIAMTGGGRGDKEAA